jgi:hypothetical protein
MGKACNTHTGEEVYMNMLFAGSPEEYSHQEYLNVDGILLKWTLEEKIEL